MAERETPDAVVRLDRAAADELLAFRRRIIDGLPDKDFLHEEPDEPGFVARLLGDGALTLGIVADRRIVAYTALILPAVPGDLEAFGLERCLTGFTEPGRLAYIAATMVAPEYRGHGIQNRLTRARHDATQRLGRTHHLATAALGNRFSWRNAISNGFHVRTIVELDDPTYGRLTRFLLHRAPQPVPLAGPTIWHDATDAIGQRALFESGFRGVEHRERNGIQQVGYRRPSSAP